MNRVRKDILNGWKEIAGYVCRDIRTVERWEKYRGLPVRRVPGAGRATVYALISEVDQWLASTKLDDSDDRPGTTAFAEADERSGATDAAEEGAREAAIRAFERASQQNAEPEHPEDSIQPVVDPDGWTSIFRNHRVLATACFAGTLAVAIAVVWPLIVHARRGEAASTASGGRSAGMSTSAAGIPYRSKVPGVDEVYLSGMYFYEQRTPDSLKTSLQDFTDAIRKDPNYAPAYVGLANTYNLMREYSGMPDNEAYPKAKLAAEHAIALDPKLPQAHASLGFIDFFWSWDAEAAEREFQTALALDPSGALAHHWYGSMLVHQGRFAEALEQLDIAQRLEPTSAAIVSLRAMALGLGGHRDEAVAMLQEIVGKAPSATSTHNVLSTLSLMQPRNLPRYLEENRKVAELRHDDEWLLLNSAAEHAYRTGGEAAMWKSVVDFAHRSSPLHSNDLYQVAQAQAVLGHTDQAIAQLTDLVNQHDPIALGMHNDPTLISLHRDPRFAQLETRIACPPLPGGR